MTNQLQQAADYINSSTIGAVATLMDGYVSVQVPGLRSLPGNKVERFYSTENVRSLRAAISLVGTME